MAVELNTQEDYKQVERLGLLPTDRDPSAWLRMVARVFAAYKEIDITKSIAAYISGFWILNKDSIDDGLNWKFVIQKGTCFIDDQFIGFTDDIIFKYPKIKLIPGNTYWLVLKYKWSYEFDYNLATFDVIFPTQFIEGEMLRIAEFKININGTLTLQPQDLDDQYASNFKKLFELAAEKIIDSLDLVKYHYEVYNPEDNKFDITCKSGDFVYLDYITGTYKPARACTKRFDKAVGIYLYNQSNNKQYVIYNGIVDFSDPRWKIDDSRNYLLALEPGTSYYLRDGCTEDSVNYDKTTLGMITTAFYPGTVRVGYAIDHTRMFIRLDYTSELNVQNLLELFGDNERFTQRYQDFYKYYSLIAELQFLVSQKDLLQGLLKSIEDDLNTLNNDLLTSTTNLASAKSTYENKIDDYNNTINNYLSNIDSNFNTIKTQLLQQYSKELDTLKETNYYPIFKNKVDLIIETIDEKMTAFDDFKSLAENEVDNIIGISIGDIITNLDKIKNISIILSQIFNNDILNINYTDSSGATKILTIQSLNKLLNDLILNRSAGLTSYQTNIQSLKDLISTFINDLNLYKTNYKNNFINLYNLFLTTHIYKDTDIILNLSTINFDKAILSLGVSTSNCLSTFPAPNDSKYTTYVNDSQISGRIYSGKIDETDSNYANTSKSFTDNVNILFGKLNDIFKSINNLNQILNYFYKLADYYLNKGQLLIKDYVSVDLLNNNKDTLYDSLNDLYNAKSNLEKNKIKNETLLYYKDHLNQYYLELNNKLTDNLTRTAEVSAEISQTQALLGEVIDEEKPVKSIFSISNYQRIIYNYSYLTQRLKIKYFERSKVENDIEILNNKLIDLYSQPVPNMGLINDLENLKASFEALLNEINFEISTMTEEYNKIRTSFLGLDPIAENDPNFDPGKYAVTDLDCLETVE